MADLFLMLPGAELDYTLNWETWLAGQTIAASSWALDADGPSKTTDSKTDSTTTIVVDASAATPGDNYSGINTIITSGGYTEQRLVGWLVPTEANLALLALLRNYQGIARDSSNALLSRAITAAIKWIEAQIHRRIEAYTDTRYYEAGDLADPYTLELGQDLLSVTTLTNAAGTVIPATEYWLLPRNGERYNQIRLKAQSDYSWEWPLDGWASVAGSWGYCSKPTGVLEQSVLRLAAFLFRQADAQIFDVVADPVAGTIIVPQGIAADVLRQIKHFRKPGIA